MPERLFFQSVRGLSICPFWRRKEVSMDYGIVYDFDKLYEAYKKCRSNIIDSYGKSPGKGAPHGEPDQPVVRLVLFGRP